jgi:hypothetical protein
MKINTQRFDTHLSFQTKQSRRVGGRVVEDSFIEVFHCWAAEWNITMSDQLAALNDNGTLLKDIRIYVIRQNKEIEPNNDMSVLNTDNNERYEIVNIQPNFQQGNDYTAVTLKRVD